MILNVNKNLMKKASSVLLLLSLWGCSSLSDKAESIRLKDSVERKLQMTDKGNNSYSGDPLEPIHVVASGNTGPISISVGEKPAVKKNEKRDTAKEEELEAGFSLDAMISQLSTAGWALLLVSFSGLLIVTWWFIKTTAVGKATDKFLADGIDTLNEKLAKAAPGTDLHTELYSELCNLRARQKAKR
jgi:hypothetical protein